MIAHYFLFGILLFFEGLSKRERCHHNSAAVEDVTRNSAVLYWKTDEIRESKIVCAGIRQYITTRGKKEVDLDTVTQFVPSGIHKAFLSQLQPNFNYSCMVETETAGEELEKSRPLVFSTKSAAPEAPESPIVAVRRNSKKIDIQLFPSSTKYGPIDGYEVQFHVVNDKTGHIHGRLAFHSEMTKPGGLLASVQDARSSKYPISFTLTFKNSSLPHHITISDSLLHGSVRSGITYCVITAAYTELYDREMESEKVLLHSLSHPSKPFSLLVTASEDVVHGDGTLGWLGKHLLKWSVGVGVISSNLMLLYFLLVGCCVMRVVKTNLVNSTPFHNTHTQNLNSSLPESVNSRLEHSEGARCQHNDVTNKRGLASHQLVAVEQKPKERQIDDRNKMAVSGSSLIFVPRGLSPSQSYLTANDQTPELEMDLYGISYSLSETRRS